MKITATTAANRDTRVELVSDLVTLAKQISDALTCAESCETDTDLDASLIDAIDAAKQFLAAALTGVTS